MELLLLLLLLISASCLLIGVEGNQAAPLPSEIYWRNKLPNTPMPTLLHDLLHRAVTDRAGSQQGSFYLYKREIPTTSHTSGIPLRKSTIGKDQEGKPQTDKAVISNLYSSTNSYSPKHKNINKYSSTPPSQQLNLQKHSKNPLLGKNIVTDIDPTIVNPGASLFFLEKNLHPGAKMNLHFVVSTRSGTTFLPQKLAKVTPFSSNKLPDILNQFNISPKSEEAEVTNETIMDCEQPAIENEEKYCATSFESLVEYGTSKIGKNVYVLTTEIVGDQGMTTQMRKQQYVVSSGVRQIVSDNLVACHSLPYPYAVFFCHATSAHTARAYVVPLVGADGMKIKATAVCHKDTSKWDPDHVAFQVLKVKPGTVPICHFLTEDTIAWVSKSKEN